MFKDLVLKNRSYRRFDATHALTEDTLIQLIELARICPSAANLQPLRYYPVHKPEELEIVRENLKWAGYLRYWDGPSAQENPTGYILILCPHETSRFHHTDAGIAAQTMLLAAVEKGLGGCILASVERQKVSQELNLPPELDICLVIAIGKPAEKVEIDEVIDPDDVEYWRDGDDVHHVPKRSLEDIIIRPETE
ncbi:MAG: nitroreductase family protein [Candidatus Cloacimonetes bacterium]|nr:nitroreductase family protein [Candidatus Cloacimonadota bacterium]